MGDEESKAPVERVERAADRIEEAAEELSRTGERIEKALGETRGAKDYSQLAGDDIIPPGENKEEAD